MHNKRKQYATALQAFAGRLILCTFCAGRFAPIFAPKAPKASRPCCGRLVLGEQQTMRMLLEPQKDEQKDNYSIRSCKIKRLNDNGASTETKIWFQLDKSIPLPQQDDCDAYLLTMVMEAMKENRTIEVKGSVSKQLLGNLVELQAAWKKWKPNIYSCIDIIVDKVNHSTEKVPGAICAFSGGVDATFSVWRHYQSKNSHRTQAINFCSIVHGFDIPLSDADEFENAKNRAQATLDDISINLIPIKTNYRRIAKANWEDAFSTALVAALSNFKTVAGTCIVGSSEPYDSLVIPWGSSPITDHLLSSGEFFVMHDGASHSRTEKVKELSDWKVGVENLRVCWQGDLKDRNCGVCEKCVRTKLNFLAVERQIPSCFPPTDILDDLDRVKLSNDAIRAEWQQLYEYAERKKLKGSWLKKVKKKIDKGAYSVSDIVIPKGSSRREMAKYLAKKLGRR